MKPQYFKAGDNHIKVMGDVVMWVFAPQFNFELKIETLTLDHFNRIGQTLKPEQITQQQFEDYFCSAVIKAAQMVDESIITPETI